MIIAEIGVNHNGDLSLAKEMIDSAKSAGADAVKFQTFKAENLVSKGTPKVKYQQNTTSPDETHYEMIKKLELSRQNHHFIKEYCDQLGIEFLSTPYDSESARFLNEELLHLSRIQNLQHSQPEHFQAVPQSSGGPDVHMKKLHLGRKKALH